MALSASFPRTAIGAPADAASTHTAFDLSLPYRLSGALATVATVAAAVGVFVPGVFRDARMTAGNAQGTSLVVLVVAVPAMVAAMVRAAKGSRHATIVWLGVLAYLLYNAVFFAFDTDFNRLFPLYVAMLSLALWSFVTLLMRMDADGLRARFAPTLPVRAIGIYLLAMAVLNALAWMAQIVPAIAANTVPAGLETTHMPTNPVHVLDLAFSLPLMALSATWLLRRRPWGYVLGGMYLTMLTIEAVSVATDQLFGHRHDPASSLAGVPIFAGIALIGIWPLAVYFRNLSRGPIPYASDGGKHGTAQVRVGS